MEETRAEAEKHVTETVDTILSEIAEFQRAISERVAFLADVLELLISDEDNPGPVKAFEGNWIDAQQN